MKSSKFTRLVLVIAGTISVGLGILGIFLPLLPTTPFLLLAAFLYARSSQRFYDWLLNNRWFGSYITNYRERRGISLKIKILAVSVLWITITFSSWFVVQLLMARIVLFLIAAGVTWHILSFKTLKHKGNEHAE
jgi:hypothetical protein